MKTVLKQTDLDFNDYISTDYEQLELNYNFDSKALWYFMKGKPRPCFTTSLLEESNRLSKQIADIPIDPHPVQYLVVASGVPGVFNLGGDLDKFHDCITSGDKEGLRRYAYACLNIGFECARHFDRDVTTISLVQGSALGGGFEAALSCNVVVAEESAQFGFPEILFNLFPGMGAYTYLSRRVHPNVADKVISSGRTYTAAELHAMGIIDMLVPDGEGVAAVENYIKQHSKQRTGRRAMQQAYLQVNPVSLEELQVIADIWVETAMQLDERSLRVMKRLTRAQSKKMSKQAEPAMVA